MSQTRPMPVVLTPISDTLGSTGASTIIPAEEILLPIYDFVKKWASDNKVDSLFFTDALEYEMTLRVKKRSCAEVTGDADYPASKQPRG